MVQSTGPRRPGASSGLVRPVTRIRGGSSEGSTGTGRSSVSRPPKANPSPHARIRRAARQGLPSRRARGPRRPGVRPNGGPAVSATYASESHGHGDDDRHREKAGRSRSGPRRGRDRRKGGRSQGSHSQRDARHLVAGHAAARPAPAEAQARAAAPPHIQAQGRRRRGRLDLPEPSWSQPVASLLDRMAERLPDGPAARLPSDRWRMPRRVSGRPPDPLRNGRPERPGHDSEHQRRRRPIPSQARLRRDRRGGRPARDLTHCRVRRHPHRSRGNSGGGGRRTRAGRQAQTAASGPGPNHRGRGPLHLHFGGSAGSHHPPYLRPAAQTAADTRGSLGSRARRFGASKGWRSGGGPYSSAARW